MVMASAPLTRRNEGKVIAGVAAGLADRLDVSPLVVRIGFVALAFAGATGILLYVLGWLLMPPATSSPSIARTAVARGQDSRQVVAVGLIVLGVLLLLRQGNLWFDDAVVWPVTVSAMGLYVIWRQAGLGTTETGSSGEMRRRLSPLTGELKGRSTARLVGGVALVAIGVGLFLAANDALAAARQGLLATGAVVSGLALVFAPWWARLVRDLADERRARIRSQERADLAAHLHDSVLQTLALIQRNSGDARAVSTLARQQERELRSWMYTPAATTGDPAQAERLAARLKAAAEEVEDHHGVPVEVVTVGDCALDDRLAALVLAAREALSNAARHSGAASVALYGEVEDEKATVFVRDRGDGFDAASVPTDRRGIADSIVGRMARHGGRASVRATPGEGTEVELVMPRTPGAPR
ncbi:MAG: ATP-binding protein [Acidimicrobiales bacterium]